jgi:hypothetical protein
LFSKFYSLCTTTCSSHFGIFFHLFYPNVQYNVEILTLKIISQIPQLNVKNCAKYTECFVDGALWSGENRIGKERDTWRIIQEVTFTIWYSTEIAMNMRNRLIIMNMWTNNGHVSDIYFKILSCQRWMNYLFWSVTYVCKKMKLNISI